MPRRPRIDIPGFYHVLNRGVEQRAVFITKEDYEYFEELICFYATNYNITIHNYCLMNNHYHLLIEISNKNLSKFMRQLNMNYAIYFNKKYKRVGHLWQGRFKSWYVTNEAYLYNLMRYIEQNPLKAGIVQNLKSYPYSSYRYFLDMKNLSNCLQNSWIAQHYHGDIKAIEEFLNAPADITKIQELKTSSSLIETPNIEIEPNIDELLKLFKDIKDTKERNITILKAYQDGYSQHMIAKALQLNQSTINRIINRMLKAKRKQVMH